ncbi:MAG: hypothetical protein DLM72_11405 [Candidatus Nitrosopolaris wilkensis]|nr:MAG: hypothetical protein DLM72_11405 [Candidatus Nitrosopolaris wilkensis]
MLPEHPEEYEQAYFPKLLTSPNVPLEDKDKIRDLLIKPWNPYIRRHTALTEKSLNPKISHILNQHAEWVQGSSMSQKYLHYFGNESSESILEEYGIVPTNRKQSDILKPKQCPQCNEPNQPDGKFCAKCRMVLKYDGYVETLEKEKVKDLELSKLGDRVTELEEIKRDLITMYDSYRDANRIEMAKTDEDRNREHEMQLREAYPTGKFKYVKLIEETTEGSGEWREITALH